MYIELVLLSFTSFFFFNDTATTEIYTLSLHDALPIWRKRHHFHQYYNHCKWRFDLWGMLRHGRSHRACPDCRRSEEHTSELQSHLNLVCRLLLEKKKNITLRDAVRTCFA